MRRHLYNGTFNVCQIPKHCESSEEMARFKLITFEDLSRQLSDSFEKKLDFCMVIGVYLILLP